MKVFFDEECLLHNPPYEFLSGKLVPHHEAPKRLSLIRQALEEDPGFQIENADRSIDVRKHALLVHSEDYIEYLESAFELWAKGRGDPEVRTSLAVVLLTTLAHSPQGLLFPEVFPHPKFSQRFNDGNLAPQSLTAKAGEFIYFCLRPNATEVGHTIGYYCFDLSCPITAGSSAFCFHQWNGAVTKDDIDTYISVVASARVTLSAAGELLRSGESVFALS